MIRATLLILALALAGCAPQMTNEEIVRGVKYCESNGMNATVIRDGWTGWLTRVECEPKVKTSL